MLAVRLHGNSDLRVDQVPEPDAVGPGQVRVEPQWCGICGTDLHEYAHGPLYTPAENLPQVMGHEFSAVIAETGPGVTAFRPGDRVAVLPHVFCGSCTPSAAGQGLCSNLQLTGVTWPWGGRPARPSSPRHRWSRCRTGCRSNRARCWSRWRRWCTGSSAPDCGRATAS